MAETGAGTTSGNETAAAAAADVPTINTKPAAVLGTRKTELVEVPEAYILQIMWQKACAPRRDFPAWKPKPDDSRVELIRAYEKAAAVMKKWHQHDDDLILQYINNGCAYEEVQIADDDE